MTSRERVMAAFEHEQPDRVPCWCGSSDEFWAKAKAELGLEDEALRERFADDFRRVYSVYAGPKFVLSKRATSRTVFGVERRGLGYGQPINHPLANADIRQIHDYPWPDPRWMDVSNIKADAEKYGGKYAILGGEWSPFWHDAIDLMGMENLYLKMYSQPDLVEAILKHVVDFYLAVSRLILDAAAGAIDIFFIGNDFGGKNGPLMGPTMFAQFILPQLKRLIDLGHDYGLKVQLHCCGGFSPLIPLMVEAGLDALHAVQPNCRGMDLQTLKEEYGDKILFNGAIDSQHVLINGNPEKVRKEVRRVLDIMMPGGGYVAGASHDTILEDTPVENVLEMFDAVLEYGVYDK